MGSYSQDNRPIAVKTPLGKDKLLLQSFTGQEEISRLFRFNLELLSETDGIAANDIVGKEVTFHVQMPNKQFRYFHGFVSRFTYVGKGDWLNIYRAEVVPWLWFLTRTSDCRIFQEKKVPDIIEQVFSDLGFSDYEMQLTGTHELWDYCVQYRETDFNFVSRLMEQEGIFYYFKHEDGKHKMVLADHSGAYASIADSDVKFETGLAQGEYDDELSSWEHQYQYTSGKWVHTDYNFETPSTDLKSNANTTVKLPGISSYEWYDYPGEYEKKGQGDSDVKLRMQEEDAQHDVVCGSSYCRSFSPGGKFTVGKHYIKSEANKGYALTSVRHTATVGSSYVATGTPSDFVYRNSFTCIPDKVNFRPQRITRKPTIQGIQSGVVVGKSGEEIHTDEYGRVKVQFHWDREGKKDEKSSCWIRVAHTMSGKNWGSIHIPRIGQEVIVSYLEGDPDRPLITGMVYNAETMPPYTLPDNKTQSGIKTRSTKSGSSSNFNELRFEDKKDSEEVYFHAEKDFNRVVENNDTLKVGFDKKDKGNQEIEIFNTQKAKIGCPQASEGSQLVEIWKDQKTKLKQGNREVKIEMGNDALIIKMGNRTTKLDMGNQSTELKMGNQTTKLKLGNQTTKLDLGKSSTQAMQSIELKVGGSSVKVDQMGVTIKGMMIKINGQMMTEVKGMMTQVKGDAMLMAKGGITMIN